MAEKVRTSVRPKKAADWTLAKFWYFANNQVLDAKITGNQETVEDTLQIFMSLYKIPQKNAPTWQTEQIIYKVGHSEKARKQLGLIWLNRKVWERLALEYARVRRRRDDLVDKALAGTDPRHIGHLTFNRLHKRTTPMVYNLNLHELPCFGSTERLKGEIRITPVKGLGWPYSDDNPAYQRVAHIIDILRAKQNLRQHKKEFPLPHKERTRYADCKYNRTPG